MFESIKELLRVPMTIGDLIMYLVLVDIMKAIAKPVIRWIDRRF